MDIFSNYQVAWECLFDEKRTKLFESEIRSVIKEGMIVLDAGSGTGVMAMISAKAGASKVFAVEIAPDLAALIERNTLANGLSNVVSVINEDITKVKFDDKRIDLVVMEMLDTGMTAEQQSDAINHLIKEKIINQNTVVVPESLTSYVQLVDYSVNKYGLNFSGCVQARNYGALSGIRDRLSKLTEYETVSFREKIDIQVNKHIEIAVTTDGLANGVLIKSKTQFPSGRATFGTSDMCMPIIVPIEGVKVKKGGVVRLDIMYLRSRGLDGINIHARVK